MYKRVIGLLGIFLIFAAVALLVPLALALAFGEKDCVRAFLCAIALSAIPGLIIRYRYRNTNIKMHATKDKYLVVTMCWIVIPFVASIPFLITKDIANPFDAFFEMCSGFSTTGATILTDIESLPRSLLFWRSMTQWVGGMGIIVLVTALLPSIGVKAQQIASAETPGLNVTKLTSRFSGTAQRLYIAYIVLSAALVVLLMFGGMDLYDAVTHTFTAMATGGFSPYADSIAHFHSTYIMWVLTIFMFLAGTNFNLFFVAVFDGFKKAVSDEEFRAYLIWTLIATALVTASLMISGGYHNFWRALTDSAFHISTLISTTGFSTQDYTLWPAFSQIVILLVMLTGASSSSTAGGIKMVRVTLALKMIKHDIKTLTHDKLIDKIKLNGKPIDSETLTYIVTFVSFFFVTLFAGLILISFDGFDFLTNLSAVITCLSNVGPGLGQVGPASNFSAYSSFSKLLLSFIMIAGRLELTTVFVLFSSRYWNSNAA